LKWNSPRTFAIAGIGVIAVAIVFGPFVAPPEFSWMRHSTSEQAGQQMTGAWIMRTGFVSYGLCTMAAAFLDWKSRTFVRFALVVFGLGLISTAIWSNASIVPGVTSDMREDRMHSVASGIVGTAFAAACAARLFAPGGSWRDALGWTGLLASVVLPLAMGVYPDIRGLVQRTMFAISFVFVGREFAGSRQDTAGFPGSSR
jgi:hypothetical protein